MIGLTQWPEIAISHAGAIALSSLNVVMDSSPPPHLSARAKLVTLAIALKTIGPKGLAERPVGEGRGGEGGENKLR